MNKKAITIIIPAYGDWPSLNECLKSLKKHVAKKHSIMLVNDCGPQADRMEKNIKKLIKDMPNASYFRNKKNLGFVGTCNRAVLELENTKNDILLLNSDTRVTGGFLEEMRAVLYNDKKMAAVSPRSNNATIATVPLSAAPKKGVARKKSYRVFKKLAKRLPRYNIVPVTHGFCMLIRREVIDKFGLFDPVFGKGYGEEVDFCQRIKRKGYKCALANRAYVFHLEARSFTLETKQKLLDKNNQIIWKRYPDYRDSVREYMTEALKRERFSFPLKERVKQRVISSN